MHKNKSKITYWNPTNTISNRMRNNLLPTNFIIHNEEKRKKIFRKLDILHSYRRLITYKYRKIYEARIKNIKSRKIYN